MFDHLKYYIAFQTNFRENVNNIVYRQRQNILQYGSNLTCKNILAEFQRVSKLSYTSKGNFLKMST